MVGDVWTRTKLSVYTLILVCFGISYVVFLISFKAFVTLFSLVYKEFRRQLLELIHDVDQGKATLQSQPPIMYSFFSHESTEVMGKRNTDEGRMFYSLLK